MTTSEIAGYQSEIKPYIFSKIHSGTIFFIIYPESPISFEFIFFNFWTETELLNEDYYAKHIMLNNCVIRSYNKKKICR